MGTRASFSGSEGPFKNEVVTLPCQRKPFAVWIPHVIPAIYGVSGRPTNSMSLNVEGQVRHGDGRTMNILG
jgi:hypothetical protein